MLWAMRRIQGSSGAWPRVALALCVGAVAAVALCVPLGSAAPALTGPAVALSPSSLTFPDQPVGTRSDARAVTLTNTGDTPLTISTIHLTGPDAAEFGQGAMCPINPDVLPAGASCTIYVAFAPESAGTKTASLEIGDDGPASPQTVALSGNGIGGGGGTPGATVTPGSLVLRRRRRRQQDRREARHADEHRRCAAHHQHFPYRRVRRGRLLAGRRLPGEPELPAAGGSCTIYVAFTPHSPGSKSATLQIGDNAPDSPQTVSLSGNGILAGASFALAGVALVRRPARRYAERRAGHGR